MARGGTYLYLSHSTQSHVLSWKWNFVNAVNRLGGRTKQREFPSLAAYFEMVISIISL